MHWCLFNLRQRLTHSPLYCETCRQRRQTAPQILPTTEIPAPTIEPAADHTPTSSEELPLELSSMIPESIFQPPALGDKKIPKIQPKSTHITDKKNTVTRAMNRISCPSTMLVKCDSLSGTFIPNDMTGGSTYNVATIQLDTTNYGRFEIHFTFACNIRTINAAVHINFQIVRQFEDQLYSEPVSSNYLFTKIAIGTESNSFTFSVSDPDPCIGEKNRCCRYHVYATLINPSIGNTYITNSILTALIERNLPE